MKHALSIFALLLSLSFNLVAGLEDVRISIEPNAEKTGHYELRIQNDGPTPVSYSGYGGEGSIQPIYEKEVKKGEQWIKESPGWCGDGIGPCHTKKNCQAYNKIVGDFSEDLAVFLTIRKPYR